MDKIWDMRHHEIRQKFKEFMESKGHTWVPSSSLLPDDPSVLLTTAGMQQFKPYYTELDPETTTHPSLGKPVGKNAASIQKSFRTSDIDEVGDETHHTFFEMLGNFSFGGYFKKEAIEYAHEFITEVMGLTISYVTVFKGSDVVPKDEESQTIWNTLGITDVREEGMNDVFWGPTGTQGPCGPTTEVYCKNASGQDVEVWNIVFNQFFYPGSREELLAGAPGKELKPLEQSGVDTGMGLERLVMISQKARTNFDTDLLAPIMELVPSHIDIQRRRIIADHARGITFLLADGVEPSNKGAGYVLRRLLRRVLAYEQTAGVSREVLHEASGWICQEYGEFYPELIAQKDTIWHEIENEREKFAKTLDRGIRELKKLGTIDGPSAFRLYESYGLPYEAIKEMAGEQAKNLSRQSFEEEFQKHQEKSRAGSEKKFGGHGLLLDTGELKAANEEELAKVTRLHTATHLLHQALRMVLGNSVHQAGSDITVERTRFDFTFDHKLSGEEIKKVEDIVNDVVEKDLLMQKVTLPKGEAEKTGALYFFKEKYPDPVNVYFVGETLESAFSKEFCGGPHVTRTNEIGQVKIIKEEAVSAGVRRIRATVS